ncbi:MAG: PorT family protein [Paludibacteraceae bacterium]|nr:PorT family protein [Paludibacteraceae bacterium]
MKRLHKILLTFLMVCFGAMAANAQSYRHGTVPNLVNSDNKPYHFGFILGFNSMCFNPQQSGVKCETDGKIWYGDDVDLNVGFTIGIISDLKVSEFFDVRFTPTLYFGERTLRFVNEDGKQRTLGDVTVKSNVISFPILAKFRGQRMGNFRPYLLGGVAGQVYVGRDKEAPIMLTSGDYGIEVGFGFDIYLPYFKLAPEFKAYLGMGDVLNRNRRDIANTDDLKYNDAFSKLSSRIFSISFNFE